jgi:hypothetical protein
MMAKRSNRVAWGLAAVLAVVLVSSLSAFVHHGLWAGKFNIEWEPIGVWDCWWVGTEPIPACGPRPGPVPATVGETYSLGFIEIDVWDDPSRSRWPVSFDPAWHGATLVK